MKKILAVLLSLIIASCTMNHITATAKGDQSGLWVGSEGQIGFDEEKDIHLVQELELNATQLEDGVTVLMMKNESGEFEQFVYTDLADVPQPMAGVDGKLDWALFHLGFKDWNQDTGDLYFTISSDEPMNTVKGTAYVKSTSILFPKDFYRNNFSSLLYGEWNSTKPLADDIDTEEEEKVRVGFSDVVMSTITGEKAYFINNSDVVNR